MADRMYRLRRFRTGRRKNNNEPFWNYSLTVPSEVASKLPADVVFECTVSDEGILYRPIRPESITQVIPRVREANSVEEKRIEAIRPRPVRPRPRPGSG